jgi:hypothetical protein
VAKIELTGGSYTARSLIASAQRCMNLYPEKNPPGAAAEYTHYPTPGLELLVQGPVNAVRGLYTASNNELFAVIGNRVYYVDSDWVLDELGTIGSATTPVVMCDNSTTLVLVDGSRNGYMIDLASHNFGTIVSPAFYGANIVDYLDSFLIFNRPNTKQFYTSDSSAVTFDPLYFASKNSSPDRLISLIVKNREIWLLGAKTTEVWYNVGASGFPFAAVPGTAAEHGCAAKHSVSRDGSSLYWLSLTERGQAVVLRTNGYDPQKISTFALEAEWSTYTRIDDAVAYCYQNGGHTFYVITFPTADKTWVYDAVEGLWHERGWMDPDGILHRHRSNCHAFAYGTHVVGDFENGRLYRLSMEKYTDNGDKILRIRAFPHLGSEGKRVIYNQFVADMEVGQTPPTRDEAPMIRLRWSDTRGYTWNEYVMQNAGEIGEYLRVLQWRRLGMARGRCFELSWSFPAKTALNGAYIDAVVAAT